MRKYRASRLKQLIFPQELIIDKYHVLSRKRHFPAFWTVNEESIPLSKLASIQIHRGLFFSKIIIENAGGPYPIILDGLWNRQASEARDLLEMIEREMQSSDDISDLVGEDNENISGTALPDDTGPPSPPPPRPKGPVDSESAKKMGDWKPPPPPPSHSAGSGQAPSAGSGQVEDKDSAPTAHSASQVLMINKNPLLPSVRISMKTEGIAKQIECVANPEKSSGRKIGEVPKDWNPPAPWETVMRNESDVVEDSGIREIDPVEFLNQNIDPPVAVATKEKKDRKSGVHKLIGFWNLTKDDIRKNRDGVK